MNARYFVLLATLGSLPVLAQTQDLDWALQAAAQSGQPAEVMAFGQPVRVVPVAGRECPTVGVIYTRDGGMMRGGPRIDNFRVCPGQAPQRLREVSPALPDDGNFRQVVQMSIRNGLRGGSFATQWQGYFVETRRLSELDRRGCALSETIIANDGLLVSYNSGRACL